MTQEFTDIKNGFPLFTLIVPVAPSKANSVGRLIESICSQDFDDWEVLVVSESGTANSAPLADFSDERIASVAFEPGGGLAGAIGRALEIATGRFVAMVGSEDVLRDGSLHAMATALEDSLDVDVAYSDEERLGRIFSKPDYSPERLRSQNYLGDFAFYRRSMLASIGGMRASSAGAELYDLALRATTSARRVLHVPDVLLSAGAPGLEVQWAGDHARVLNATRLVLTEHLESTGGGWVERVNPSGVHTTHRSVSGEPLVSIIIPTRGSRATVRGVDRCLVVEAVRSVITKTSYANFEFVIVIDDVSPEEVFSELREIAGERVRFVTWSKPFSFSEKMNLGVIHARGDYVLFLNDDVEVIAPMWLEAMLALAQRPKAGLVGAMLYFEDETIQHAGHAYYKLDVSHIGLDSPRGSSGPFGGFRLERETAGVTCACALMAKELFFAAGGFSPLLPGNFNDVDLCMKVAALGYQSYWTPYAELYHFESKTRNPRVAQYEIDVTWRRWEHLFYDSPLWPMDPHLLYPIED